MVSARAGRGGRHGRGNTCRLYAADGVVDALSTKSLVNVADEELAQRLRGLHYDAVATYGLAVEQAHGRCGPVGALILDKEVRVL